MDVAKDAAGPLLLAVPGRKAPHGERKVIVGISWQRVNRIPVVFSSRMLVRIGAPMYRICGKNSTQRLDDATRSRPCR